jgi:hypothetical protein
MNAFMTGPPAGTLVAADALVSLIVAALRAAGRLDAVGPDGLAREIEDGLATGDPHERRVLKVVELADELLRDQLSRLHRAYVEAGARPIDWQFPSLRDVIGSPPAWLPRFYDLADRFRHRPALARQLPQVVDMTCYDALLGGTAWKAPAFDHLFTVQHRQALLIATDALAAAAPHLADRLAGIRDLSFDRVPPVVADRHSPPPNGERSGASQQPSSGDDSEALIPRPDVGRVRSQQPAQTTDD